MIKINNVKPIFKKDEVDQGEEFVSSAFKLLIPTERILGVRNMIGYYLTDYKFTKTEILSVYGSPSQKTFYGQVQVTNSNTYVYQNILMKKLLVLFPVKNRHSLCLEKRIFRNVEEIEDLIISGKSGLYHQLNSNPSMSLIGVSSLKRRQREIQVYVYLIHSPICSILVTNIERENLPVTSMDGIHFNADGDYKIFVDFTSNKDTLIVDQEGGFLKNEDIISQIKPSQTDTISTGMFSSSYDDSKLTLSVFLPRIETFMNANIKIHYYLPSPKWDVLISTSKMSKERYLEFEEKLSSVRIGIHEDEVEVMKIRSKSSSKSIDVVKESISNIEVEKPVKTGQTYDFVSPYSNPFEQVHTVVQTFVQVFPRCIKYSPKRIEYVGDVLSDILIETNNRFVDRFKYSGNSSRIIAGECANLHGLELPRRDIMLEIVSEMVPPSLFFSWLFNFHPNYKKYLSRAFKLYKLDFYSDYEAFKHFYENKLIFTNLNGSLGYLFGYIESRIRKYQELFNRRYYLNKCLTKFHHFKLPIEKLELKYLTEDDDEILYSIEYNFLDVLRTIEFIREGKKQTLIEITPEFLQNLRPEQLTKYFTTDSNDKLILHPKRNCFIRFNIGKDAITEEKDRIFLTSIGVNWEFMSETLEIDLSRDYDHPLIKGFFDYRNKIYVESNQQAVIYESIDKQIKPYLLENSPVYASYICSLSSQLLDEIYKVHKDPKNFKLYFKSNGYKSSISDLVSTYVQSIDRKAISDSQDKIQKMTYHVIIELKTSFLVSKAQQRATGTIKFAKDGIGIMNATSSGIALSESLELDGVYKDLLPSIVCKMFQNRSRNQKEVSEIAKLYFGENSLDAILFLSNIPLFYIYKEDGMIKYSDKFPDPKGEVKFEIEKGMLQKKKRIVESVNTIAGSKERDKRMDYYFKIDERIIEDETLEKESVKTDKLLDAFGKNLYSPLKII